MEVFWPKGTIKKDIQLCFGFPHRLVMRMKVGSQATGVSRFTERIALQHRWFANVFLVARRQSPSQDAICLQLTADLSQTPDERVAAYFVDAEIALNTDQEIAVVFVEVVQAKPLFGVSREPHQNEARDFSVSGLNFHHLPRLYSWMAANRSDVQTRTVLAEKPCLRAYLATASVNCFLVSFIKSLHGTVRRARVVSST